jgi:glutathione S-transferase
MLELWQTEWCPASRRIRARLTELGVDYLSHQVPVDREQRTALREQTGSDTIPALVDENGTVAIGEEAIRRHLDEQIAEPPRSGGAQNEGGQSTPPLPRGGMRMLATSYTLSTTTEHGFSEAAERVRTELKLEGFGILCEIDAQATLKEKLGVARRRREAMRRLERAVC